jgi:hypothetical protein
LGDLDAHRFPLGVYPGHFGVHCFHLDARLAGLDALPARKGIPHDEKDALPGKKNFFFGKKDNIPVRKKGILPGRKAACPKGKAILRVPICAVWARKGKKMNKRVSDWVPSVEETLLELMTLWHSELGNAALQTAYGWPAAECAATVAELVNFSSARAAYQAAPTKSNHVDKEAHKKTAVEAMRKFARERIRNNNLMTDAQRTLMGVPAPDKEPSPIPVPNEGPASRAETNPQMPGVVKIRYLGAKPYGVDRVEIAWSVSETPIEAPDLLTHSDSFPKNPWEHHFPAAERGKKVYYSLRYLTREGKSNWSGVNEVIIP